MRLIDIHSHIVFDVDDGPKTRQDTRELLTESYRQGVRTIISTSHRRKGMFETPEEKIAANFHEVQQIAKEVADDLTILYGAEIYYTSDILEKLDRKIIPTLGGTSYALIEFSMITPYRDIHSALSNVLRLGITPVVAHIERYHCLENDVKKVQDLINMGCYMQINSSSVLKPKLFGEKYKFMKKRAQFFMEQDLVHFVASDMHNLGPRPPYMEEAYHIISNKYGNAYADQLFRKNQEKMKNQSNQAVEIDILSLIKTLWRRKFIIVVTAFVMAIFALIYSTVIAKPSYSSTTRIYVVNRQQNDNSTLNQDLQAGTYLVKDYKEIILSQDVLTKVIADLKLKLQPSELAKKINVTVPTDTRIVSIAVSDGNAEEAARIANSVRQAAAEKIIAVTKVADVTTLEAAEAPKEPSSPNIKRNTLIGFLAGGMLMSVISIVVEVLDDRIKKPEDVEEVMGITLLGVVPNMNKLK